MSFTTWAISLPRWILQSRSDFAWILKRSFCFSTRQSKTLPTTAFSLPLPVLPVCVRAGGPNLSKRRLLKLCKARALHVIIVPLNYVYLGRFPTFDELGRRPNSSQLAIIARLRALLAVCGASNEPFPIAPGRSGPELVASLFQLEHFVASCPELQSSYLSKPVGFREDPTLLPFDLYPELLPYRSLDASRLRLVGEGKWPMADFLHSPLWLPFVELAVLRHGLDVDEAFAPNFSAESRDECARLMRVWDARGLLDFFEEPAGPGLFCRVFKAFKNEQADRQIGDRPSRFLPTGPMMTQLHVKRFSQCLVASVTDRRDSLERSQTNLLPFSFCSHEVDSLEAWKKFVGRAGDVRVGAREETGDLLGHGGVKKKLGAIAERAYPAFSSLFQGDHLGVEFALCAHQSLLEEESLLAAGEQIRGRHVFPKGPHYSGLVIDDFFFISPEPLRLEKIHTAASKALARARQLYARERLLGSDEKDVDGEPVFKAAGAEVISDERSVRSGHVTVWGSSCQAPRPVCLVPEGCKVAWTFFKPCSSICRELEFRPALPSLSCLGC